jgi:receptor expression-enhancing protein 1/2/3/4
VSCPIFALLQSVASQGRWDFCRVPFYYEMKTFFLLYLALPQTRGSTYLYKYHLEPFFHAHESEIDAALASFKARVYRFLQERLRLLWDHVAATIGQPPRSGEFVGTVDAAPPSDPLGPGQLVSRFWQTYGPSLVVSGTALLRQVRPAMPEVPVLARSETSQSVLERRRQLEAELASLPPLPYEVDIPSSVPVPAAPSPSMLSSSPSSSSGQQQRKRTVSGGKFEEIEAPSDLDGEYVSGDADSGQEFSDKASGAQRPSSWWGWGSGSSKKSDERIKSE